LKKEGNIPNMNINKKFREELIACFPWYDTGHIENDASNNSSIVACVFVTAVTFLSSRCLATIRGYTHTQAATWSHKPTLFFQNNGSRLKIKNGWTLNTDHGAIYVSVQRSTTLDQSVTYS
jgi:hypothetical protein